MNQRTNFNQRVPRRIRVPHQENCHARPEHCKLYSAEQFDSIRAHCSFTACPRPGGSKPTRVELRRSTHHRRTYPVRNLLRTFQKTRLYTRDFNHPTSDYRRIYYRCGAGRFASVYTLSGRLVVRFSRSVSIPNTGQ